MGGGSWSYNDYDSYTSSTRGVSTKDYLNTHSTAQEVYVSRSLAPELNPYKITRECHDSEEHPNTLPVILALDVTGSMGDASVKVAKKLNEIMTTLYADPNIKDIEFCVMGIGDLAYDHAPIQMSQFESDVRIAEQLDKIYFEGNGGGNKYESYTAAWYMGARHTNLHCWNRGKKGIIITMGDEGPNPYLPQYNLERVTGDKLQGDVETAALYEEVTEKYDVYHISVDDPSSSYRYYVTALNLPKAWGDLLGDHYFVSNLDNLAATITNIITNREAEEVAPVIEVNDTTITLNENGEVSW